MFYMTMLPFFRATKKTSFPPQFSRNQFIPQAFDFRHTIHTLTIYIVELNRTIDLLNNQTPDGQHRTTNSKSFLFVKQKNEGLLEQIYATMVEIISLCFQLPAVSQPISLGELSFSLTNASLKQIFKKSGIGGGVTYCFCKIKVSKFPWLELFQSILFCAGILVDILIEFLRAFCLLYNF